MYIVFLPFRRSYVKKSDNYQLYETNYFIIYDGFAVRDERHGAK